MGWLSMEHFRPKYKKAFNEKGVGVNDILEAVAMQANVNARVFAEEHPVDSGSEKELTAVLLQARELAVGVWGDLGIVNMVTMNRHAPPAHFEDA